MSNVFRLHPRACASIMRHLARVGWKPGLAQELDDHDKPLNTSCRCHSRRSRFGNQAALLGTAIFDPLSA